MTVLKTRLIYTAILVALTLFFYQGVLDHEFLIIDDHIYVTNNPHVQQGLTLETVRWAFTTVHAEFYHPLTWLSLMLDTTLFGPEPAGYKLTNLLLHTASSVLVFLAFSFATGQQGRSFVLAALFALHPLHVEAVAWIAERKEVLCGFFWIAAIYAYFRYVKTPGPLLYGVMAVLFGLGLLSKSMIVTFPFALLLLDVWPLKRWPGGEKTASSLIIEKLPLFAITAAGIGATLFAQQAGGGIVGMETYSLGSRIANALVAYQAYLFNTFFPINLAVFYPFRLDITAIEISAALFLLIFISLLTLAVFKKKPFLLVGWCWFLGILVPVIGIVKIGDFAMADRYMYMPLLGLLFAAIWLIADALVRNKSGRIALIGVSIVFVLLAGLGTRAYLEKWHDSKTLFTHAAEAAAPNFLAHYSLGHIFAGKGRMAEAEVHFKTAVALRPDKQTQRLDLGRLIASQGRFNESARHFQKVIELNPDNSDAFFYKGLALLGLGQRGLALDHLTRSIQDSERLHETVQTCLEQDDIDCALKHLAIKADLPSLQKYMARGYQHWIDRIQTSH